MKYDIEIWIGKLFNGTISDEEKTLLAHWYNQSDKHKARFAQLKSLWMATHPPFAPDTIDTAKAETTILQKINAKPRRARIEKMAALWRKTAAVLLLPLLALAAYLWITAARMHQGAQTQHHITALPATRTKIALPDGTEVWLNAESTLSYPAAFRGKERKIALAGEAYFLVQADKRHPFIISANGLDVRVTGTQLNVEAYADDSLHVVTLVSGSAEVLLSGHATPIRMKPNQHFLLNTRTGQHALSTADASLTGDWKEGVLTFRDETLEDVFRRIARTFNAEIRIKDPRLAKHQYRATFKDESLRQILDLIQLSAPIRYTYSKNTSTEKEIIEVYYEEEK